MTQKSNVYTRRGDDGTTSLANGQRVEKTHARLEAYGTVDELNAHLGLMETLLPDEADKAWVRRIQNTLFTLGGLLANPDAETAGTPVIEALEAEVAALETAIDETDAALPPLRAFILPGGCPAAAQCHVCRTVCRRAERRILTLRQESAVPETILTYVNRLSDFLFVLSRKANFNTQTHEITWDK